MGLGIMGYREGVIDGAVKRLDVDGCVLEGAGQACVAINLVAQVLAMRSHVHRVIAVGGKVELTLRLLVAHCVTLGIGLRSELFDVGAGILVI